MYRLGKQAHRHRRGQRIAIGVFVLLIIAGLLYWLAHLRISPTQQIKNSPSVSTAYNASETAKVNINKPEFTMELPAGWTERQVIASPTGPRYTFASPSSQSQVLDFYIDNPPTGMALNRAIVVDAQGNGLAYDRVSDNCITFTDPKNKNAQTGHAPARWQEIDFICDMSNFSRALVGTISKDGINQVAVAGEAIGNRKVFISYTDNSISPNYGTLYDILGSIKFK